MELTTEDEKSIEFDATGLDAFQANFVWSFFPESKSSKKKSCPFQYYPAQVRFSNLKHALQIYESIPKHANIVKIGLNALIVLAINDFASSVGNNGGMLLLHLSVKRCLAEISMIGRMRHCWGHGDAYESQSGAYFALRPWDDVESSEWKSLYTPKHRLELSTYWSGWHWNT